MRLFFVICLVNLLFSCSSKKEKPTFTNWYKYNKGLKNGIYSTKKIRSKTISSQNFRLDTIYRSMMGPSSEHTFQLADSGDVVWLVGYEVNVFDSTNSYELSPEFMCHNNLNLTVKRYFPWKADVFNYTNRVFTLTQGFTELNLPEGFGIPFPSNQNFKAIFQALNHNILEIDTTIKHEIILRYFLDSEIDFDLKALSQNTVWLVKQYDGPMGVYGEKPLAQEFDKAKSKVIYSNVQQPSCGVDMLANNPINGLDLYYDNYGRKFTGHWKIAPGKELLKFNATKMMNLKEDKTLYYATAHVHPYCEFLELKDITENKSIFKINTVAIPKKIGLEKIAHFSSKEGVDIFQDHEYELISSYNNTGTETLSAMSVVYLYWNY